MFLCSCALAALLVVRWPGLTACCLPAFACPQPIRTEYFAATDLPTLTMTTAGVTAALNLNLSATVRRHCCVLADHALSLGALPCFYLRSRACSSPHAAAPGLSLIVCNASCASSFSASVAPLVLLGAQVTTPQGKVHAFTLGVSSQLGVDVWIAPGAACALFCLLCVGCVG